MTATLHGMLHLHVASTGDIDDDDHRDHDTTLTLFGLQYSSILAGAEPRKKLNKRNGSNLSPHR